MKNVNSLLKKGTMLFCLLTGFLFVKGQTRAKLVYFNMISTPPTVGNTFYADLLVQKV